MGVLVGIEEAVEEIRQGRMVILVDDADRENGGDLTMAAEKVTPEAVNFIAKYGRGLLCLSMTPEKIDLLGLPMMVSDCLLENMVTACINKSISRGSPHPSSRIPCKISRRNSNRHTKLTQERCREGTAKSN